MNNIFLKIIISLCVFLTSYTFSLSSLNIGSSGVIFENKPVLSYGDNPAFLSLYPYNYLAISNNLWDKSENNFKNNIDLLVDNMQDLKIPLEITPKTSIRKKEYLQDKYTRKASSTLNMLYDMRSRGSSMTISEPYVYMGLQFANIGLSALNTNINSAYFSIDGVVNEGILSNISQEKNNYGFWSAILGQAQNSDENTLNLKKAYFKQYALHYANKLQIKKQLLHLGISIKYVDANMYTNVFGINKLKYEQVSLLLNSLILANPNMNDTMVNVDLGAVFESRDKTITLSYAVKDVFDKEFMTYEDNISIQEDNTSVNNVIKNKIGINIYTKQVLSMKYRFSKNMYMGLTVDLFANTNIFNDSKSQYIRIAMSKKIYKTDTLQLGIRHNIYQGLDNMAYSIGYSSFYKNLALDIGYKFSSKSIADKTYRIYDRFGISLSYKIPSF